MQQPNYEEAFLTQLDLYSRMFGVRWVVNLCHTFIMDSLQVNPRATIPPLSPRPSPIDLKIETDSLADEELPSFIPPVEEATLVPSPPPAPPVEPPVEPEAAPVTTLYPIREPSVKVLRLKKAAPLVSPTHSSPEAKQILTETVKKTSSPKKRAPVRDMDKLVKLGLLPAGTKVVPSAPEIKPDIYGIVQVNASGKAGIQPSWNPDTLFIGKSNAPIQFLAAVNKQFPSHRVYGRENAWNDLLKVNPSGSYVSLADLWLQSR